MLNKQRVILIEDEELPRRKLKGILECQHKDMEVVGEAETTAAGWRLLEQGGIDGVFLDIHIQTESHRAGMDLAHNIKKLDDPPWIVFVTGYDEFALEAHDVQPAAYLVKPLDDAKVKKALDRIPPKLQSLRIEIAHRVPDPADQGKQRLAYAYLNPQEQILFLCTDTDSKRLRVHRVGCHQKGYEDLRGVAGTLNDWEKQLAPCGFEIPHRSYLVNTKFIDGLVPAPYKTEAYELSLRGCPHKKLPVSREYWRNGRLR